MLRYILILLLIPIVSFGQEVDTAPLTDEAFRAGILKDLNFILFGEDNPKEGLAYSLSTDKSKLELSGKLPLKYKNILVNLNASFEADGGTVILDDKDGAKKASIQLDFYKAIPFFNYKTYPNASQLKAHVKIARFFKIPIEQEDTLPNPLNFTDDHFKKLSEYLKYYFKDSLSDLLENKDYDALRAIATNQSTKSEDKPLTDDDIEFYKDFKTLAFLKTYKELKNRLSESALKEERIALELEYTKDIWTSEQLVFLGLGFNYAREFLDVYTPMPGVSDFNDLFEDERGNLYGTTLSINFYKKYKKGLFGFGKLSAGLNRVSTFSEFSKKEFVSNTPVSSFDEVVSTSTKNGYYSEAQIPYTFAGSKRLSLDAYVGYKQVGVFAQLGMRDDNFAYSSTTLPCQYGFFIGIKGKEKDLINLLVFIDRENLKEHPNGDTNVGFRVGLPFNIR